MLYVIVYVSFEGVFEKYLDWEEIFFVFITTKMVVSNSFPQDRN